MNSQKVIIQSLAMDLKRVALGLQRGSLGMARRFKEEALQREHELEQQELTDYLKKLVINSKAALQIQTPHIQDDVLMYSTLFENYAHKIGHSSL